MNLVYNCDDNFIRHAAVSFVSAFRAAPEERFHVWILGKDLRTATLDLLQGLAEACGQQITVIPLDGFEERVRALAGGHFDAGRFTTAALARIFAPAYLPQEEERYLYIDSDTLVMRSLSPLWETETEGKTAAMVAEPTIYREVRNNLGLADGEPYFNSGVMLVNRRLWIQQEITEQCMEYFRACGGSLPFPDQDLLNHALRGKVHVLPPCWNFFTNYYYEHYHALVSYAPWYADCTDREKFAEAKRNPGILHFSGDERPWIAGNLNPARREYRHVLAMTPWKDTPELSGKRAYMLAYHMMNALTLVCPAARRAVSKAYYAHSTDTTKL